MPLVNAPVQPPCPLISSCSVCNKEIPSTQLILLLLEDTKGTRTMCQFGITLSAIFCRGFFPEPLNFSVLCFSRFLNVVLKFQCLLNDLIGQPWDGHVWHVLAVTFAVSSRPVHELMGFFGEFISQAGTGAFCASHEVVRSCCSIVSNAAARASNGARHEVVSGLGNVIRDTTA